MAIIDDGSHDLTVLSFLASKYDWRLPLYWVVSH